MARTREIDARKYPEQSRRIKRAMRWAGLTTAAQLHERVTWGWSERTTSSRIEGDTKLETLERAALAKVLDVHPDVLLDDGPGLPELPPAGMTSITMVTGGEATFIEPGKRPVVMTTEEARRRGLILEAGQAEDPDRPSVSEVPSKPPPPLRTKAGQDLQAAKSRRGNA